MEEKPDVTYSDVGGCKEQIEKLREVVETPLLHVSVLSLLALQISVYEDVTAFGALCSLRIFYFL